MTLLVSCGASTSSDQPAPTTASTTIPATPAIEHPTAMPESTAIPLILAGKIAIWQEGALQVKRNPENPAPSFAIGQAVQPTFKIHSDP